jgi:multiple sugar transport system substrate-binding protein
MRRQAKLGLAMVGLAATGLLSACSTSASTQQSGNSNSGKVVLTEEDYYTTQPSYSDWNSIFAEFEKTHPNIIIKRSATVPQTQYLQELLNQAGAGALPDVVMIDNPYVAQFAKAGVLTPLDSIGNVNTSDVAKVELSDGEYNGTLYAVPPYTNTAGLIYNKKMFAAAGISSPPATWSQLISDAKKLTTSQHYGFGTYLVVPDGQAFWSFAPFLWSSAGADATANIGSPQAVAALNVLVTMERNGSMPKSVVDWDADQVDQEFISGKLAMEENGPWNFAALDAAKNLDWGTAEFPVPQDGDKLLVPTGGETWAIPTTDSTAQKKAALTLLNWLLSPQEDVVESVDNGLVPTVKAAVAQAVAKEGAPMEAFAEELEAGGTARTEFTGTETNTVETAVGNAVQQAVIGPTTASQALQGIAASVSADQKSGT